MPFDHSTSLPKTLPLLRLLVIRLGLAPSLPDPVPSLARADVLVFLGVAPVKPFVDSSLLSFSLLVF